MAIALFIFEFFLLFFFSRIFIRSLSLFFYQTVKSQKVTTYLLSFLFFPGTVIHELSHMFAAIILLVPVGNINLFPTFSKREVKLGSVEIAKTDPFRRAIIGFAPVIAGLAIMIGVLWYFFFQSSFLEEPLWKILIAVYVLFEIGNTMFSSKKDLEGTLELVGTIAVIVLLLYIVGVRVPETIIEKLLSEQILEFIKTVNLLLLVPIGINFLGWGVIKALNR